MIDITKLPELPPGFHWLVVMPEKYFGIGTKYPDTDGQHEWYHWWYEPPRRRVMSQPLDGGSTVIARELDEEHAVQLMTTMCQLGEYGGD